MLAYLEDQHEGTRLRAKAWRGLAIGDTKRYLGRLESETDRIYRAVEAIVQTDFPCPRVQARVLVVFVSPPELNEIVVRITGGGFDPSPEIAGSFVPEYAAAFISGIPGTSDFFECCAHELSHAILNRATGACGRTPWSFEGYAILVADNAATACNMPPAWPRDVSRLLELHRDGLLQWVLERESHGVIPHERLETFGIYAGLFVRFLWTRAENEPRIRSVIDAAVAEKICGTELLEQLQEALGTSVAHVEEDLLDYCHTLRSIAQRSSEAQRQDVP